MILVTPTSSPTHPIMGECFRAKRPAGNSRSKWQKAVWRDVLGLPQIRNRKMTAWRKEGWRTEIGETMAREWAEHDTRRRRRGTRTSSYFRGGRTLHKET
jgi:hypothetical protein